MTFTNFTLVAIIQKRLLAISRTFDHFFSFFSPPSPLLALSKHLFLISFDLSALSIKILAFILTVRITLPTLFDRFNYRSNTVKSKLWLQVLFSQSILLTLSYDDNSFTFYDLLLFFLFCYFVFFFLFVFILFINKQK